MNHSYAFIRLSLRLLLSLICIFLCSRPDVYGQYTVSYAQYPGGTNTGGTSGAGGAAGTLGAAGAAGTFSVTSTANLNDTILTNFATVSATSGKPGTGITPGAGGSSTAYINMTFGSIIPSAANPVILKLQATSNSNIAPLSQVTIQAYNGASTVGPAVAVSTLTVRATDEYVFVPAGSCSSIRITVTSDIAATLIGGTAASNTTANVYYAYVFDPTCGPSVYTTTNVTGLLSLNGVVNNPYNATDNNMSTYTGFSVGLGLGATLHENIYYGALSNAGDVITATMSMPSSPLSAGLLGSVSIIAYNGGTTVSTVNFSALLQGTDLLSLLQTGAAVTITFDPGGVFNRVEVTMSSLAGLATSLNLYEVARTGKKPTFTLPVDDTVYACYGTTATMNADAPGTGYELKWFATGAASDQTALYTGTSFSPAVSITHDTLFWVAKFKTGCAMGSERVPVRILMRPLPTITLGINPVVCILGTNAVLPYTATTNSPTKYSITWNASPGMTNVADNTLAANSISINIPIGVSIGTKNGTLTVKNANNCSSTGVSMSVTVKSPPVITPPIVTNYQ